jgi:hypothetical protein
MVESGFAEQESNSDWWKFGVTISNSLPEGGKVVVSAYDLPGNVTIKEMDL